MTNPNPVKARFSHLVIPAWGMDWASYETACRYLGLSANPVLYEKLSRYLLQAAARQPAPKDFSRWLAELRPGKCSLGFLDIWTRLLMPSHPWRYRLNAIVAMHECDSTGFREMMRQPGSRAGAWLFFFGMAVAYFMKLVLGSAWLGGQALAYAIYGRGLRREQDYYQDKTVLITGAGRGLGLALSARLFSFGAHVLGVVRPGRALDELRDQIAQAGLDERFQFVLADVAVSGALAEGLAAIGVSPEKIDIAIINAGIKEETPVPDSVESIRRVFDVNVFGAMDNAALLLPVFKSRGWGHMIFISSQGRWHGMPVSGSYNASKAALSLLVESMEMDLDDDGRKRIHLTSIEPGLIRTGMAPAGLIQKWLAVDAGEAATKILHCAASGSGICRFPRLFTLITAAMAILPGKIRVNALGRMKRPSGGRPQ
jgi:NAD(P)-dependent dehydrogenase (short-subunit alcohol dehydrogenase family)